MEKAPIFFSANLFENKSGYPVNVRRDMGLGSFPLHRHEFIEMTLVTGGKGVQTINGAAYPMDKKCLCVILPWHSHEYQGCEKIDIYNVQFGMEFLLNIQKPFTQINDMLFRNMERDPCVYLDQDEFEEAEHLFAKMNDEFQHHRTWKETLLHTLIFQALVFYDRKHAEKETLLSAAHLDRKETTALSIIEYINANLEKDITIHDAAKHASVGEAGLNKLLKETLSVNFSEILQEARLRKASALLKTTLFSIDEVAAASGYRNTNTFEKVFKMTKGMPPEQFRKSNLYTEYVHTIIKNLPDSEALFQQISPDLKNVSYADILYAQVRLYLYQHFSEDITLKKLTKVFHYNESYLSEILAAYHASFNDILREARIHHASTLLRTTPIPAVDIGFAVGFNSRETFMRAFKSLKGVSPGAFRKATPGGAISAGKPLPKP